MASGPRPKRPAASGRIGATVPPSSRVPAHSAHAHIEALIHGGGQIMIGTMQPIRRAAVAHDGSKTLVMLRCQPEESLTHILSRLETAISSAKDTGQRVDEINGPSADHTYEY